MASRKRCRRYGGGESPDDREPERYALDTLNQAYIDLAGARLDTAAL